MSGKRFQTAKKINESEDKMKKNIMKFAALALVVLMLAACGGAPAETTKEEGKPAEAGKVELTVQAEEAWVPHYEAAIARVKEAYPDAEITIKKVSAFDHLNTMDNTDAGNPDVADVFALPIDRIFGLAQNEVLASIDAKKMAKEVGGWDNFDAGIGGQFLMNGEYLAFPFNIETLITFANKANAEATEVDLTKPVEVTEIKNEATALLPLFDYWYGVAATNSAGIEPLVKAEDGKLSSDLTADWSELAPEKQALFTALFDYWKKNADAGTALFDADAGWGYIEEAFSTGGKGVVRITGPWDTANLSKQAGDGNDLEIFPLDKITIAGKPLLHWKGGWGLGINARIEGDETKMAVATKLIEELVNPKFAADLFKTTGKILENVKAEDYAKMDLPELDKKVIAAVIESYQSAQSRPLFLEFGKVWDTWKNAVLSWNSVKPASPEDAYKEIQASFKAMMDAM